MFDDRFGIEWMLHEDRYFSFSRWGDGEWQCILGVEGANCDGHQYFADLRHALAQSIIKYKAGDGMYFGMQKKAMRDMGREIVTWLLAEGIGVRWYDADILHNESKKRGMEWFHDLLKGRRVILVGPDHLKPMAKQRGYIFVRVESKNAWLKYRTVGRHLERTIEHGTTILYCAGMMSNVLIKRFHRYDRNVVQIDCGSVFDVYAGVCSRRYHAEIAERIKREGK